MGTRERFFICPLITRLWWKNNIDALVSDVFIQSNSLKSAKNFRYMYFYFQKISCDLFPTYVYNYCFFLRAYTYTQFLCRLQSGMRSPLDFIFKLHIPRGLSGLHMCNNICVWHMCVLLKRGLNVAGGLFGSNAGESFVKGKYARSRMCSKWCPRDSTYCKNANSTLRSRA